MIWRNANGRLSLEAYIVVAVSCLIGGIVGIYYTRVIDARPVVYVFDQDAEYVETRSR